MSLDLNPENKQGDRSSKATLRLSNPTPTQLFDDDEENDAESQFSYVQSMTNADLSYNPQVVAASPQSNNAKPQTPTSKKLFDEIRSSLDNLNIIGNPSTGVGMFQTHNKRESYNSTISQYSGKVDNAGVEPVSVISVNQEKLNEEEEEGGLKRGLSVTRVSPTKNQTPKTGVPYSTGELASSDNTPKLHYPETFNEAASIRTASEAYSIPVGPLETVNAKPSATPTSLYSDASEGNSNNVFIPSAPSKSVIKPNRTSNTQIESTIPPRSSRRPKSGIFDESGSSGSGSGVGSGDADDTLTSIENTSTKKKRHSKKRSSLSVTDGLDELMRNANQIKTKKPGKLTKSSNSETESIDSGKGIKPPANTLSDDVLRSEVSHDIYMTADEENSSGASTEFIPPHNSDSVVSSSAEGHQGASAAVASAAAVAATLGAVGAISDSGSSKKDASLPPRPTADNIKRAREVSRQISLKEEARHQQEGEDDFLDINIERSDTLVLPHGNNSQHSLRVSSGKILSDEEALPSGLPGVNKEKSLPMAPSEEKEHIVTVHIPRPVEAPNELVEPLQLKAAPSKVSTPANASTPINQTTKLSTIGISPIPAATTVNTSTGGVNALDDDEFYDIEPISKPARAKSVKQSTTHQKSKSKLKRKSRNASGALKPFSYQTLISLLESTNGTVIGEEFSQLDLPAKEKQLIEKIIDALSRLSADMVLDRDRYEIGISRLENALRVLEGFM